MCADPREICSPYSPPSCGTDYHIFIYKFDENLSFFQKKIQFWFKFCNASVFMCECIYVCLPVVSACTWSHVPMF